MEPARHELSTLEKQRSFIIRFAYWSIILACAALFAAYVLPVLVPFLVAFAIAALLNKPIHFCTERLHLRRSLVSVVMVLLLFLVVGGLLFWIVTLILSAAAQMFSLLPGFFEETIFPLLHQIILDVETLFSSMDPAFVEMVETNASALLDGMHSGILHLSNSILSSIAHLVSLVPSLFMQTVITIIVTFFLAADYELITGFLKKKIPAKKAETAEKLQKFLCGTLPKFILNYALIFSMTFVELAIGLSLLKIPYAVFIAMLIAVLDILPILGTGGVLIPWAIISLIMGNYFLGIGIFALYVAITVIRNIVEPKLIGKQMGLHPVLTLASMLVGLRLFGLLGLFGMPILLSFLKKLHDEKEPVPEN